MTLPPWLTTIKRRLVCSPIHDAVLQTGTWAKSHRLVIKRVLKQLNQRLRKFQMAVLHLPESCSPIEPTMSYPSLTVG